MKYYITIDGGTTNTRIRLIENRKILDSFKVNSGATQQIDNPGSISQSVKQGLLKIKENNYVSDSDIVAIIASGMITSEFGLYNLPHIVAPAGKEELHNSLKQVYLREISNVPFYFIPGIKCVSDCLDDSDIMRGEETEVIGIQTLLGEHKKALIVLPGSHSKIIQTDSFGKIAAFVTTLTGEMISALSQNTILKDAINLSFDFHNKDFLKKGYDFCENNGLNESLFKVRILKNIFNESDLNIYSFFLGAILHDEVKAILKQPADHIIIGGKKQIKAALAELLAYHSDVKITALPDHLVEQSTSIGMLEIYNG